MNNKSQKLASHVRQELVRMVYTAKSSHVGGSLSVADILAVLYEEILQIKPKKPRWPMRDRLIFSKGHCCSALYATLALKGFFPLTELETYGKDGSRLMLHASHKVPGVEISTGSLGHGLSFGCGKALAAKRQNSLWKTFVILSDGELDEGSNWEAALFAHQLRLDNLVAIIDYNKIQSLGSVADVLDLEPLAEKFKAFRWAVKEINGHDHAAIRTALASLPLEKGKPTCVIAHTVKGKGIDFMENQLKWHYSSPDQEQLKSAITQIKGCVY